MHISLSLYIPSNNTGKNIIINTFNILDSDPVRSWVEGSPAFSRYPGRAYFPYISLENSLNHFFAKHRLGLAGTKRVTRLAGSLAFEGRVTLPPEKTFCHVGIHFNWLAYQLTWPNVDSQSMREHCNCKRKWSQNRSLA